MINVPNAGAAALIKQSSAVSTEKSSDRRSHMGSGSTAFYKRRQTVVIEHV